jgi:hypothetical protein
VAPDAPWSAASAAGLRSLALKDPLWTSRDVIEPGLMSAPVINRRTVALETDVMASVTASAPSAMAIFFMSV